MSRNLSVLRGLRPARLLPSLPRKRQSELARNATMRPLYLASVGSRASSIKSVEFLTKSGSLPFREFVFFLAFFEFPQTRRFLMFVSRGIHVIVHSHPLTRADCNERVVRPSGVVDRWGVCRAFIEGLTGAFV